MHEGMHEWIDLRFEISSRPQHDIRIVLKGARVEPTLWQLISGSQGRGFGGGENSLEKERAHRYICPCHAPHFFSQCGAVLQSVAETPPQSIEGFCRVWPNASSHDVVVKVAFDSHGAVSPFTRQPLKADTSSTGGCLRFSCASVLV